MSKSKTGRLLAEGFVPLIDIEGTPHEAGVLLGYTWAEQLRGAARVGPDSRSWWLDRGYAKLIDRYAPHLPDLYRGMAKGAGVPEDKISTRAPADADASGGSGGSGGCTSFAVAPRAALHGQPLSGQTKDTGLQRMFQFQVLRLKLRGAPSALTLTYEGWLFGHGFVQGGCAIFRNSLYAGNSGKGLKYGVWGMLALHCRSVEEVVELTRRHGLRDGVHCTIADEQGGVVGLENGKGGTAFLKPKAGIYAHANCVVSNVRMRRHESCGSTFTRADSEHRGNRMQALLNAQRGRITPQLVLTCMSDHEQYPRGICRHEGEHAMTTAAVVAEPTRGVLHVTRGNPCQNWPRTYRL